MKIFLTADTHFGHKNLAEKIESRPPDYEECIIQHWQDMVSPSDLIVHLGDIVVGRPSDWESTVPKLPGRKILVLGNHDKKTGRWYMQNGFDFCCSRFTWEMYGLEIVFSHKPIESGFFDLNIHGHLHGGRHPECYVDQRHYHLSLEETRYQPKNLESIVKAWKKSNNGIWKDSAQTPDDAG